MTQRSFHSSDPLSSSKGALVNSTVASVMQPDALNSTLLTSSCHLFISTSSMVISYMRHNRLCSVIRLGKPIEGESAKR